MRRRFVAVGNVIFPRLLDLSVLWTRPGNTTGIGLAFTAFGPLVRHEFGAEQSSELRSRYALRIGATAGISVVLFWLGFWLYVEGRFNSVIWVGIRPFPHLTSAHFYFGGPLRCWRRSMGTLVGANVSRKTGSNSR